MQVCHGVCVEVRRPFEGVLSFDFVGPGDRIWVIEFGSKQLCPVSRLASRLDRGGPLNRAPSTDGSIFGKRRGGFKGPECVTFHVDMTKYLREESLAKEGLSWLVASRDIVHHGRKGTAGESEVIAYIIAREQRGEQVLTLRSLSPFYSVWDSSPQDFPPKFWVGLPTYTSLEGNALEDEARGASLGDSKSSQVGHQHQPSQALAAGVCLTHPTWPWPKG